MWVSPNHPNPPSQQGPSSPPEERGERLAVFPRGQREELRVSLDTFEGHEFVRLQLWEVGGWPIRGKGCSIRLREVADLAEALTRLASRLDADDRPAAQPSKPAPARQSHGREPAGASHGGRSAPRRDERQSRPDEVRRPAPQVNAERQASRPGFDEFG